MSIEQQEFQYGRLWCGERVSFSAIKEQTPLCAISTGLLIKKGIAVEDLFFSQGEKRRIVSIPQLQNQYEEQLLSKVALVSAEASLPYSDATAMLRNYGDLKTFETPSQNKITILPTCVVPIARFVEGQFDADYSQGLGIGNFRRVYFVIREDGSSIGLVAKTPERVFNGSLDKWYHGKLWYGGKRSGHRPIYIKGNPVVEEQAVWEAVFLLELARIGIKAELPQALIEHADGSRELVVREIKTSKLDTPIDALTDEEERRRIEVAGLVPEDFGGHNLMRDLEGYSNIIDVNRWSLRPHTTVFRERLADEIRSAVAHQVSK